MVVTDFLKRTARKSKILKGRNEVEESGSNAILESNMWELCGRVLSMGVNGCPDRILTWSLEGRNKGEIPIMIWEWEVERVVKQDTQYTAKYGETVTLEHSWL